MPKNHVSDPVTDQQRFQLNREQVLKRLWEIANLSPEMTRNSVTGQVKALSMIVAIENIIPDRRAAAAKNTDAIVDRPQIYKSAWLTEQEAMAAAPEPDHVPAAPEQTATPAPRPRHINPAPPISPSQPLPEPHVSSMARVPDATGPYFSGRNPFSRRR